MRTLLDTITSSDVTIIEMAPAEMPAALKSGQIDGYCVAELFGAKAVDAGIGHVFTTSQDLWPDSICCGIVFNKEAIKDKKEAVRDFDRIFYSAGDTMTTEEAMFLAKKYLNQNENISRLSLQWISFTNLSITPKAYQYLTNKVREFGLSQNLPSYTDFVKNES